MTWRHGNLKTSRLVHIKMCGAILLRTYRFNVCVSPVSTDGNDSNLLIVFYVQIVPDDFVMQLHRF